MRTIPVSEARAHLNQLIDDLVATDEEIVLTKHGRPVATVRSTESVERAEETAFWAAQPGIAADVAAARDGSLATITDAEMRTRIADRAGAEGVTL